MTPRSILRLYPRAWRERYGDEMSALLETKELTKRDVFDLARLAAAEWLTGTIVGALVVAALISWSAVHVGGVMRTLGPQPHWISLIHMALSGSCAVIMFKKIRTVPVSQVVVRSLLVCAFLIGIAYGWENRVEADRLFVVFGPIVPSWIAAPSFVIAFCVQSRSDRTVQRTNASRVRNRARNSHVPRAPLGIG